MRLLTLLVSMLFVCTANAAVLDDYKAVGHPMGNSESWIKVVYDFAKDGGAIADYDAFIAQDDLIVTDFAAFVETAVTGTPVFDLGIGAGDVSILSDRAHGTLTIGTVHGMDTAKPLKIAKDAKMVLGIETAAASAGKIHMHFKVKNVK